MSSPSVVRNISTPRWLRASLAALVLLHVTQPLAWGRVEPGLWYPAAGAGFAVLAWRGPAGVLLILLSSALVLVQALACRTIPALGDAPNVWRGLLVDTILGPAVLFLGWWLYQRRARGARRMTDPRSVILFLLFVPGLAAGVFALARAGAGRALDLAPPPFLQWLAVYWLSWALGLLVVAPPLLIGLTPWLVPIGLALPEEVREDVAVEYRLYDATRAQLGDWIEILGLAAGASLMGVLLAGTQSRRELAGWQLWGAPQLLIFWASLRQGLRGGSIVAGSAAALALFVLALQPFYGDTFTLLLQGNLLAQCSTGLLVAASASWIQASEKRYRQAVTCNPVAIYSARFQEVQSVKEPAIGAAHAGRRLPRPCEVTLVSAASTVVLGRPPEQLLGDFRHWLDSVHLEDRVILQAALMQLERQREPVSCEYRVRGGKDQARAKSNEGHDPAAPDAPRATRWVRDTLAPQYDACGRLSGWEGVVVDITDQRALADGLRRSSSMLHALVANLPAGVFVVQGHQGRPILVNARARQLLGQRDDTAADLEHLTEIYRLFRADGTPFPVEELPVYQALRLGISTMRDDLVVHRPDGRRIPLVTWAAPVQLPGNHEADAAVWVFEELTPVRHPGTARRDAKRSLQAVLEGVGDAPRFVIPAES